MFLKWFIKLCMLEIPMKPEAYYIVLNMWLIAALFSTGEDKLFGYFMGFVVVVLSIFDFYYQIKSFKKR